MSDEPNNHATLTTGPVGWTLAKMAGPMLIGFVSMVVFNLVDTYFVSKLGTDPLAAMSFTFPVVMIVFSVAFGIGMGAAAVVSRAIGEGDQERVKRLSTDGLVLAVVLVLITCVAGLVSMRWIFQAMKAEAHLIPLIEEYMRIWLIGMVFVVVPIVGNSIIRSTGDTKIPAIIMLVGAGLNAVLDPLLIFGMWGLPRMEIAGAALATVIARAVTLTLAVVMLHFRYRLLVWSVPTLSAMWASWRRILSIGLPACLTNVTVTFLMAILTRLVASLGGAAVAAVGVGHRILHFPDMMTLAVASSLVPFIGQNSGAGRFDRIRSALRGGQLFALIWGGVSCAALAALAWPLADIFSDDDAVLGPTVEFLRIVPIGMAIIGPAILTGSMLNGLHRPMWSAVLRIVHMSSVVLLAWAGLRYGGYTGLLRGIVIADIGVASVGVACGWWIIAQEERRFAVSTEAQPPPVPTLPAEPEATSAWD